MGSKKVAWQEVEVRDLDSCELISPVRRPWKLLNWRDGPGSLNTCDVFFEVRGREIVDSDDVDWSGFVPPTLPAKEVR